MHASNDQSVEADPGLERANKQMKETDKLQKEPRKAPLAHCGAQ